MAVVGFTKRTNFLNGAVGYYASGTVADGETSPYIHIPAIPDGRIIGITVLPASGAEATAYLSMSSDAAVIAETANYVQAEGTSKFNSITTAVQDNLPGPVSGIYFESISGAFDWEILI